MKHSEVALVLTAAAAFDRREVSDEDVLAWHELFLAAGLADLSREDAQAAVVAYYSHTRQWLMPSDIVEYCKSLRSERIKQVKNLDELVDADPNDGAAWHAARQALVRDIASGRRAVRELGSGR